MESLDERAARLQEAQDKSLETRFGPDGLIGVPDIPQPEEEPIKVVNPIDDSCYDALVYIREGMARQQVIDVILIRNRISKEDAERIVDQVIAAKGNENVNSDVNSDISND